MDIIYDNGTINVWTSHAYVCLLLISLKCETLWRLHREKCVAMVTLKKHLSAIESLLSRKN